MFRKPFRVKTNMQLKGSDRKKFRSNLERCFPATVDPQAYPLTSKENQVTQTKLVCHRGEIVQVYSINADPVVFEYLSKWFLTVYAIWKAPSAVPVLLTWEAVIRKLSNGADLMIPGVVVRDENRDAYMGLSKGDVVQIRVVGCSQAVAIGVMLISGKELVTNQKGKAVQVVQIYGDHLWEMGSKTAIDFKHDLGDEEKPVLSSDEDVEETEPDGDKKESCDDNVAGDNGETKENKEEQVPAEDDKELGKALEEMRINEPRDPQERMDDLLKECFLSALKSSHKHIQLPILTSIFYSNYVMACAPDGQTVEIKKSSFKKVSKFLAEMEALNYITIKEEKKGVEMITGINEELLSSLHLKPEFHPKTKEVSSTGESSSYQMPEIRQIFLVTAEVLPIIKGYMKGSIITLEDIRLQIKQYVQENNLQTADKRIVQLEPILARVVLAKNEYDTQVTWETLNRRILSKCQSAYEIRVPNREPIIKKGAIEPITISVATRCGNKKVTLIHGFETFGIDPAHFAHQVQIGVSASTTVSPIRANNKGWQQVLIQGNQVLFVGKLLLETYKIPRNYVRGLELAPKKK
ncbi:eukaryotic translation initiation factor 2D-like [Varroa jacobsoni]|nr:eukaryotic translation initiation factor 2D-like isoform X2 [Varroa destructor]XP_022698580.1 eukaryotic translation initiation factor 2D-like [Varroa jacobsoni]XP_022698581.1 eukaryotic translation initiation factor 2D-like [Varroa jacobsoni]